MIKPVDLWNGLRSLKLRGRLRGAIMAAGRQWKPAAILVGAVASPVIWIGGLDGGIGTLARLRAAVWPTKSDPYELELGNLITRRGRDSRSEFLQFQLVLRNRTALPIYVTDEELSTSVGYHRADPVLSGRTTYTVASGLDVILTGAAVQLDFSNGQTLWGDLNWRLRYGRAPDKLDHTLLISGRLIVEDVQGPTGATWIPDPYSAKPMGF